MRALRQLHERLAALPAAGIMGKSLAKQILRMLMEVETHHKTANRMEAMEMLAFRKFQNVPQE